MCSIDEFINVVIIVRTVIHLRHSDYLPINFGKTFIDIIMPVAGLLALAPLTSFQPRKEIFITITAPMVQVSG